MASSSTAVRVGVTGKIWVAPQATAVPTATSTVLASGFNEIGYATDGRSWMLTNSVAPATGSRHLVYYYLDLVKMISANFTGASTAT